MRPLAERMYDSCTKKTRYFTLDRAMLVAKSIYVKQGTILRVYQCDFCHSFHLTHKI